MSNHQRAARDGERGSVTIWVMGLTLVLVLFAAMLFEIGRWLEMHSHLTNLAIATADAVARSTVCEDDLRAGQPWQAGRPPKLVSTEVGPAAAAFAAGQPEWTRLENPQVQAVLDPSGTVVTVTVTAETGEGLMTGLNLDGVEIAGTGYASAQVADVSAAVEQQLQGLTGQGPAQC